MLAIDDYFDSREETIEMVARKIQEIRLQMPDIRERNWENIDCDAVKLLNLLTESEDLLVKFDEFQMENRQCYPEFEDFMLQLGDFRARYTDFIDKNPEILNIKRV